MKPLKADDPATSGPYRLLAELGSGGMGRVLLGAAPDGRLVAVKHVHAGFAADDGFRARFRREVAASQKVSGAYTAAVMDSDADASTPWLASVFVAGPSLGDVVEAVGALPEELVRRLLAGLASALAEIHRVGLIHRDLKPDNVLLAEDGVRVIDFGIARAAEHEGDIGLTRTGWVVGSPPFMSPEQAEGKKLTAASDVFSLGSVLVMAATGRSPFTGSSTLQTLYDVVHAEPDLSAVPAGLRRILAQCLAKDPEARPTPADVLALLGPVAPVGRQWPPAVYGMIAAQRAAIDRLLDGPGDTVVEPPAPAAEPGPAAEPAPAVEARSAEAPVRPAEEPAPAAEARPAGAPVRPAAPPPPPMPTSTPAERRAALLTETAPPRAAAEPPRRSRRGAAVVLACVLAAAGLGGGAYALWPSGKDDGGTHTGSGTGTGGGAAAAPDKYRTLTVCSDVAANLPLPQRDRGSDRHASTDAGEVQTTCTWLGSSASGQPTARVRWSLLASEGKRDATALQRAAFRAEAVQGVAETKLGFGDEAFRGEPGPVRTCSLAVRDGNLVIRVDLGSEDNPAASCPQKAEDIARAALETMKGH